MDFTKPLRFFRLQSLRGMLWSSKMQFLYESRFGTVCPHVRKETASSSANAVIEARFQNMQQQVTYRPNGLSIRQSHLQ
jgi:hypothetical protein